MKRDLQRACSYYSHRVGGIDSKTESVELEECKKLRNKHNHGGVYLIKISLKSWGY